MKSLQTILKTLCTVVALFVSSALPAYGATLTVSDTNDSGAGSLRQALADASDGDTIVFACWIRFNFPCVFSNQGDCLRFLFNGL